MFAAALVLLTARQSADDLHPAFVLRPPEEAMRLYAEGRKHAKKKLDDYMRPWCKDLGKVRSPDGWSFTASYAMLRTPDVSYRIDGHEDQRNYESSERFEAGLKDDANVNPADRRIRMVSVLFAWPGVSANHQLTYNAKQSDVQRVKFVLLVDGDPNKALHPVEEQMATSSQVDGSVTSVNTNTATVNSSSHGSATAYGSNGSSATAYGSGYSTSTATYKTYDVEGFKAFSSVWDLSFPLYDRDGKPYVTRTKKTLVLKVIRDAGELSTTFKLSDFEKSP